LNIKLNIDGLKLDDQKCFSCGKTIDLKEGDLFVVCFDPGDPECWNDPETPAELYIKCIDCFLIGYAFKQKRKQKEVRK
jgi:hypothetical protein